MHHRRIRHDHTDRPHTATATTTITASPAPDATAAFLSGMRGLLQTPTRHRHDRRGPVAATRRLRMEKCKKKRV